MNPKIDDLLKMAQMPTPNMKALFETAYTRGKKDGWNYAKEVALETLEEKL